MNPQDIRSIRARRVWDSRGRPTVEAELTLHDGAVGLAISPAGASKGTREAHELRDGSASGFGGLDVMQAVGHVNGEIARALVGASARDQVALDRRLIELDGTPNKTRLGANATLAVSMAAAHASAASLGVPLFEYLGGPEATLLPMPQIQIFGGGAHAGRRVDIQDFMVVCPGAQSFAQALEWTAEVYRHAGLLMQERGPLRGVADEGGWWPDFETNEQALEALVQAIERAGFVPGAEVAIALDIAASEFGRNGRYTLGLESRELDSDAMIELLLRWIDKYPIVSIEDPLAEDDPQGFARFTRAAGARLQIVGDDFLVSDAALVREAAAPRRGQHGAAQAEPARHLDGNARGLARGARARLCRHRLGTLGGDRGHDHRPSGGRLELGSAQGRLVCPRRADGEVERGGARRGAARLAGALRRRRGVRPKPGLRERVTAAPRPRPARRRRGAVSDSRSDAAAAPPARRAALRERSGRSRRPPRR